MARFRSLFRIVSLLIALAAAVCGAAPTTAPAAWSPRAGEVLKAAAAAGRETLVWFSGSGWNAESDAVESALRSPAFLDAAGVRFTLARADFPAGRETGDAFDPQLTVLAERYGVTKLPALLAIDASGRPYGTLTTPAGNAAACLRQVEAMSAEKVARDAAFTDAKSLSGKDRAAALDRGLKHAAPFVRDFYAAEVKEILSIDADGKLGLASKYGPLLSEAEIDHVVQTEIYPMLDKSRFADVIKRIDKLIAEARPTPEQRQLLIAFKGQAAYSSGDQAQALRWLDDAAAIDPTSPAAERIAKAKAQIVEAPAVK